MFKGFFETFLFPDRLLIANKKFRKEINLNDILDIKVNHKNILMIYAKPNVKIALLPTTCISTTKYCIFIDKLKKRVKHESIIDSEDLKEIIIDTYKDFQVLFFDTEWRYRNYNQYLSRTCDLYYIQNFVDMLLYKYQLLQENLEIRWLLDF